MDESRLFCGLYFVHPLHKSYLSSRSNVYCFLRILTFLSLRNAEELSSAAKNASCAVKQLLETANENQCASFPCNSNRPRSGNTMKPVVCGSLGCDAVWHWVSQPVGLDVVPLLGLITRFYFVTGLTVRVLCLVGRPI
jgi:hypothetical protein